MTTSEPAGRRVELVAVLAAERDHVDDDVRTVPDRREQLGVVGAVGLRRAHAELREPVGQRAGARDSDDVPAVACERCRRGAADHPRPTDENRARHYATRRYRRRAANSATTAAESTTPAPIWSERWMPLPAAAAAASNTSCTCFTCPFAIG